MYVLSTTESSKHAPATANLCGQHCTGRQHREVQIQHRGLFLHNDLHDTFPVDVEVDLVIVDYGVNEAVPHRFDFDINNVKLGHETLISHVRRYMIHMPALIYAESFISSKRLREAARQAINMAEVRAPVTSKYDIPMVSGGVGNGKCDTSFIVKVSNVFHEVLSCGH